MNTNEKHEVVARMARRSLMLVGLLVPALCLAAPSRAQSSSASTPSAAKSAAAAISQAQAPPAGPQSTKPAATAQPAAPAEKNPASQAKGPHEGIAVHGHWTIEVRNPDGTVVTRREFENALQPGGYAPLAALIAGNSSSSGLTIGLDMKATAIDTGAGFGALLARIDPYNTAGGPCYTGNNYQGFGCLITTTVGPVVNTSCGGGVTSCSATLTQNAPTLTRVNVYNGNGIQLSGTATAGFSSTITDVETFLFTCDNSISPLACSTSFTVSYNSVNPVSTTPQTDVVIFTERDLDGDTAAGAAAGDPMPVPVSAGQTIAVTVTISFK